MSTGEDRREREDRFRKILEDVPAAILLFGPGGEVRMANKTASRVFGLSKSELLGKTAHDPGWRLIHEDGSHVTWEDSPVLEAIRTKKPVRNAVVGVDHDPEAPVWLLMNAEPELGPSGEVVEVIATALDITDRKRALQELRDSEERYRNLFERNLAGVYQSTLDGRLLDCNDAFARILGYESREEALLQPDGMFNRSAEERLSHVERLKKEGFMANVETEGRRKDGQPVWVLENESYVHAEQGRPATVMGTFVDITDWKRAEAEVQHFAYHDSLTGLPNRLLFNDRIDVALAKARYSREPLMVLVLDIDRFKLINDSLGHRSGDALLQQIGARLKRVVHDGDTVSRLGGDEFLVLMPGMGGPGSVPAIAGKIIDSFRQPFAVDGNEVFVTLSIGISLFPDDADNADTLIQSADTAMNRVKREGRDGYRLYTAEMNARARERMKLETSLRRALERMEFLIYYQPQVDLKTGRIIGAEALLRWSRGEKAIVPPAEFIHVLEETGLIVSIGMWVLQTACQQLRDWRRAGATDLQMAVNLSGRQFQQLDLVEKVRQALAETGLPPDRLVLEITESVAMENAAGSLTKLAELKALGVSLALDDFGVGYSSLSYLKRFPIDTLKIDQSFVKGLHVDPKDAALGAAAIAMAHGLHLTVIAEGVENEAQKAFLKARGCDIIQGYLVGRPMPPDDFTKLLA